MIRLSDAPTPRRRRRVEIPPMDFSESAKAAIAAGVRRDDPIAQLEYLGLTLRNINILEDSQFRITKLAQLLSHRQEELLEIPSLGASGLKEVLDCLSRYDQLDDARRRVEARGPGGSPAKCA